MRCTLLLMLMTGFLCLTAHAVTPVSPQDNSDLIRPIRGSLVLAGDGELPDSVVDACLHLCDAAGARVAVIATEKKAKTVERWLEHGALSAEAIQVDALDADQLALKLLRANAVWLEDGAEDLRDHVLFTALLRGVLERGGVVGGQGAGALALAGPGMDGKKLKRVEGFGLLPHSAVQLISGSIESAAGKSTKIVSGGDGRVGWQIPRSTALVIHHGRKVTAYGGAAVMARIAAHGDWPERVEKIVARGSFRYGAQAAYSQDLLALFRSARDRQGPLFPPKKAPAPGIEKGTLVLSGGGSVGDETIQRFIDAAGGKDEIFVCIPSAGDADFADEASSYGAGRLRDMKCENVFVLHTADPAQADNDERLLEPLTKASGVWIDGGRTYRFIDAIQGTRAHQLIREVLARDGAVGGSSAGCQVAGDFLLRGDPRTNQTLVFEGYTTGLGLLQGVILDAHFRERDREQPLEELVKQHPQLLGVGVDADTAVVIRGTVAEVVGSNGVTFIDGGARKDGTFLLESGASFDLAKRKPVR